VVVTDPEARDPPTQPWWDPPFPDRQTVPSSIRRFRISASARLSERLRRDADHALARCEMPSMNRPIIRAARLVRRALLHPRA
jgi:hypothetical protein